MKLGLKAAVSVVFGTLGGTVSNESEERFKQIRVGLRPVDRNTFCRVSTVLCLWTTV